MDVQLEERLPLLLHALDVRLDQESCSVIESNQ